MDRISTDLPNSQVHSYLQERIWTRYEWTYLFLASSFAVLLVLTNMIGVKLFTAPTGGALTTGILTYPLTFLCTDLISEIYGKRRADALVGVGFVMSMLMLAVVQLSIWVPAHPYWVPGESAFYNSHEEYQHAFESVFSLNGLLLFGSMSAYLAAQFCDNYLFHFFKKLTGGKHLWLRNNGSTMLSQLVDTLIVGSILFYLGFGMSFMQGLEVMAAIYVYKLAIAALDTPLIYMGRYLIGIYFASDPALKQGVEQ